MTPSIAPPSAPQSANDVAAHDEASYVRTKPLRCLPSGGTAGKAASAKAVLDAAQREW